MTISLLPLSAACTRAPPPRKPIPATTWVRSASSSPAQSPQPYASDHSGPSQTLRTRQHKSYSRGGGWYPFYGNRSSINYISIRDQACLGSRLARFLRAFPAPGFQPWGNPTARCGTVTVVRWADPCCGMGIARKCRHPAALIGAGESATFPGKREPPPLLGLANMPMRTLNRPLM